MSWTRMTSPVRVWGRHEIRGVPHAWEELPDGRWSTVCGAVPERWSTPYHPDLGDRCRNCVLFVHASLDDRIARVIGSRWPRALTTTEIRRAVKGDLGWGTALVSLARLETERLIYVHEYGKRGHARYSAGRKLVEQVGRTYGMIR